MCVDDEHIRALAYQAAEWHKLGVKPLGSAGKYSRVKMNNYLVLIDRTKVLIKNLLSSFELSHVLPYHENILYCSL